MRSGGGSRSPGSTSRWSWKMVRGSRSSAISWRAYGIAKTGQHETAANNNDVSRPFPPVTRVRGGAEEKQERKDRTVSHRVHRVHREGQRRESDIFCPEWLRGPFRASPVPSERGKCTKVLPCHEVADGFDFPASRRKIKKELAFASCLIPPSVTSADSSDAASAAERA